MDDASPKNVLVCLKCDHVAPSGVDVGAECPVDGQVLVAEEALAKVEESAMLGVLLNDNYAVYDVIGRGGMGTVYKAIHRRLDRIVAVKTIHVNMTDSEEKADLRARFAAEARALSKLRHPGIVTVYDYGELNGVLYMILEYIEGQNLWTVLRREGRLSVERTVPIVKALLEALQVPHRVGLVHRDIKPSNVMLERTGGLERVVLIDFGIAKVNEPDSRLEQAPQTRTGIIVGTPKYMAPEQLKTAKLGPWTDQYAVGCLLYRILSGKPPFDGSRAEVAAAHLRDAPPRLPEELGLKSFDDVIGRAMAKDPEQRFRSNEAFTEAMLDAWVKLAVSKDVRITAPLSRVATIPEYHLRDLVSEDVVDEGASRQGSPLAMSEPIQSGDPTETSQTNLTGALAEEINQTTGSSVGLHSTGLMVLAALFFAVGGLAMFDLLSEDVQPRQSAAVNSAPGKALPIQPDPRPETQVPSPNVEQGERVQEAGIVRAPVPKSSVTSKDLAPVQMPKIAAKPTQAARESVGSGKAKSVTSRPKRKRKLKRRKPKRSRRARAPRAKSPKKNSSAAVSVSELRLFGRQLKACQCDAAKKSLTKLEKLDPGNAKSRKDLYNVECELVGLGCQREKSGSSP